MFSINIYYKIIHCNIEMRLTGGTEVGKSKLDGQ